jgi:general transcription factor 3C polypeptide 5 (transcription factor C subunit 1)
VKPTAKVSKLDNLRRAINMDSAASTTEAQHAPWLPIPSRAVSVVEHPAIVKNLDKGIASLGGPVKLSKVSR